MRRRAQEPAAEPWLRPTLVYETGPSYVLQNDGEYGASGTRYTADDEDDIGVVAAAKVRLWWRPTPDRLWAALEADGLSTFGLISDTKGGIYDVQLTLGCPVARGVELFLGARLLGGGADIASRDIYNWGNFLSFTAGARIAIADLLGDRSEPY